MEAKITEFKKKCPEGTVVVFSPDDNSNPDQRKLASRVEPGMYQFSDNVDGVRVIDVFYQGYLTCAEVGPNPRKVPEGTDMVPGIE